MGRQDRWRKVKQSMARSMRPQDRRTWPAVAMAVALLLYLSTFQTVVNGSVSPYTTDVGEIQNALPRWGTIHWTGYPET